MFETADSMVSDARAKVEGLSPEQVRGEIERGAVLVDLREEDERRSSGVIPGAVFAARGMLEFWADPTSPYHRPEFDPQRRIVLHCASGGRSALAAVTLAQMGYTDTAHLDGGIKAWKEEGFVVDELA